MKPSKLILLIILALFLTIILARSCQDDYDMDKEVPYTDNSEQPSIPGKEQTPTPSIEPIEPIEVENPSEWPDSIYSTITNSDFLTSEEKEVVIELNKCRTNPIRYSNEVLVPFLRSMSESGIFVDSRGHNLRIKEGKIAVQEAIDALNRQKPNSMLYPKEYLSLAAKAHCNDHGPKSLVGHGGTDGSSPSTRAKRHNPNVSGVGENIAYGSFSARDVMISFIVDDDVPDRGHRANIFRDYSNVGVSFGYHKGFGIMCVQDFE